MVAATDMLIVGAGAKAAGIATKVHVVNRLGLGPVSLKIVEGTERAASWLGLNGMTSGEEPLAVTPIKDIGFPYQSHLEFGEDGEAIDAAAIDFSWQRYMVGRRRYARWIDAGSPSVRHRDYGEYLTWVLGRATEGVEHVAGRVERVELGEGGDGWEVEVAEPGGTSRHSCGALVLTGPGVHREFPHEPEVAPRLFHCDSRRAEFERLPDGPCDVAIAGGGESALSCVMFLRQAKPRARFTVYTPMLPLSRGESFLENRVFSNPDEVGWGDLDQQTRRDFVKHSDRGVFDPPSLAAIAYDDRVRFVTGRVVDVGSGDGDGGQVRVEYEAPGGAVVAAHEYVVNCTGFDLLAQLRQLFPAPLRAEIERRVGGLWERPRGTEVPIGRFLELEGMRPRLQIPGLAGLSQGPGFANLGALGLLANRVLQPLLLERQGGTALAAGERMKYKTLLFE